MSFHPQMPYGEGWHKSERTLPSEGPLFAFTDDNRARFEEIASHYPPEQRKSAILAALYLAQEQQRYVSRAGDFPRRRGGRLHARRRRGRRLRTT